MIYLASSSSENFAEMLQIQNLNYWAILVEILLLCLSFF